MLTLTSVRYHMTNLTLLIDLNHVPYKLFGVNGIPFITDVMSFSFANIFAMASRHRYLMKRMKDIGKHSLSSRRENGAAH